MSSPDLEAMRASLRAHRRTDRLAARISHSLGQPARPIPSRTALAIEAAASRLIIAATVVCVVAFAATLTLSQPADSSPSIVSAAIDGQLPAAQDVYATMTGLTPESEAHP